MLRTDSVQLETEASFGPSVNTRIEKRCSTKEIASAVFWNEDTAMNAWSIDELRKIAQTDDLHISPFREDGKTYGTPTWIWSVVVDNELYVRAYNGKSSSWYQAALSQKAGRITAAGITKEVSFEPLGDAINDRIDDAYRAKYGNSPYLKPMIGNRARTATVKVMPRETGST